MTLDSTGKKYNRAYGSPNKLKGLPFGGRYCNISRGSDGDLYGIVVEYVGDNFF